MTSLWGVLAQAVRGEYILMEKHIVVNRSKGFAQDLPGW